MRVRDAHDAIYSGLRALEWYQYLCAMWVICGDFQTHCRREAQYGNHADRGDDPMMDEVLEAVRRVVVMITVPPDIADSAAKLWVRWKLLNQQGGRQRGPVFAGGLGRWGTWIVFTDLTGEIAGSRRHHGASEHVNSAIRDLWQETPGPAPGARWINNPNEQAAYDSDHARALARIERIVTGVAHAEERDPVKIREQLVGADPQEAGCRQENSDPGARRSGAPEMAPVTDTDEDTRAREAARLMALTASANAGWRGQNTGELARLLDPGIDSSPQLWHALWHAAEDNREQRYYLAELAALERLKDVSAELGDPVLSARVYAQLAQCHHMLGEFECSITVARHACELTHHLPPGNPELVQTLTTLVAAETEAGHLPQATAHSGQLLDLAQHAPPVLRARAQRTAAIAYAQAGTYEKAVTVIEAAMRGVNSSDDPVLWLQVRLAAVSFYLQLAPPRLDLAADLLDDAQPVLRSAGSDRHAQEAVLLEARLAMARGDYPRAQNAVKILNDGDEELNNLDLTWLSIVRGQLMIVKNRRV